MVNMMCAVCRCNAAVQIELLPPMWFVWMYLIINLKADIYPLTPLPLGKVGEVYSTCLKLHSQVPFPHL